MALSEDPTTCIDFAGVILHKLDKYPNLHICIYSDINTYMLNNGRKRKAYHCERRPRLKFGLR